ncbi:MAG: hypothetical protein Q4A00_03965 [Flavobacteriaceae bacterium]|nr:hypothetical protein [Flavobacteriaceae bacterium]
MLTELDQNFALLEDKILKINKDYKKLSENFAELSEKYTLLEKKYNEEKEKHQKLLEEHKKVKLISAISGNPEHNRLMKNHINRLIKEIDACIAQLKNSGL